MNDEELKNVFNKLYNKVVEPDFDIQWHNAKQQAAIKKSRSFQWRVAAAIGFIVVVTGGALLRNRLLEEKEFEINSTTDFLLK